MRYLASCLAVFLFVSCAAAQFDGTSIGSYADDLQAIRDFRRNPLDFGNPATQATAQNTPAIILSATFARPESLTNLRPPLSVIKDRYFAGSQDADLDDQNSLPQDVRPRFHWDSAIAESMRFLAIQHGVRMFQKKTYSMIGGNFFADWGRSVRGLRGWEDGDSAAVNYIAHPLQGALTGRIYVNNSDRALKAEFGLSKAYWQSRLKAMVWSAAWSAQFELGPLSEASIGNVGMTTKNGHSTMAYVDLVMTPTAGTGILIGEDAIDRYVLKNWIERGNNTWKIKLFRSILTPTYSASNLLRGKMPWKRPTRPLSSR